MKRLTKTPTQIVRHAIFEAERKVRKINHSKLRGTDRKYVAKLRYWLHFLTLIPNEKKVLNGMLIPDFNTLNEWKKYEAKKP